MHPPFSFRSCRKENGPCTVQKKRTPFVALRHLRASALYGGRREMVPADSRWLPDGRGGVRCGLECGFPRRECGRESGCKDAFDQLLFPRVPLRYALPRVAVGACAGSRQPPSQRQRKEKQFNAMTTPTRSAPSATGRQLQKSQKSLACPTASSNRRLHRYADPRRARRATAPERAQAAFSFGPCTARFLFRKTEKKMGGASRWTSPPGGSQTPEAAGRRPQFPRAVDNRPYGSRRSDRPAR